jgi:rhamnogalacturonyl hydrolase YesR
LLEDLPENHPSRRELVQVLKDGLEGLVRWQGTQGLWHNVLDTAGSDSRQDSCTAWMFTNAYARAYWKGWLRDPRIPEMCEKAWQGLKTKLWRGLPVAHCDGTPYMSSRQSYLSWPHTKFLAGGAMLALIEIWRMREIKLRIGADMQ